MKNNNAEYWTNLLLQVKQNNNTIDRVEEIIMKCEEYLKKEISRYDSDHCAIVAAEILCRLSEKNLFPSLFETGHLSDHIRLAGYLKSIDLHAASNQIFVKEMLAELLQGRLTRIEPICLREISAWMEHNFTALERGLGTEAMRAAVRKLMEFWHCSLHLQVPNSMNRVISNSLTAVYKRCDGDFGELLRCFISRLPNNLKFKYIFLANILDNAPFEALSVSMLLACYQSMKLCLADQHLACLTPNPLVSLCLRYRERNALNEFVDLLFATLISSDKFVRVNCHRHWLHRLSTNHLLLKEVFPQLNEKLLLHLSNENIKGGDSQSPLWYGAETALWAWAQVYRFLLSQKTCSPTKVELDWLKYALRSRQENIKVLAAEMLGQLIKWKPEKLENFDTFAKVNRFIFANFGNDDFDTRKTVCDLIDWISPNNKHSLLARVQKWLQRPRQMAARNADRTVMCLKLLKKSPFDVVGGMLRENGFELARCLIELSVDEAEQSVRSMSLEILLQHKEVLIDSHCLIDEIEANFGQKMNGANKELNLVLLNLYELLLATSGQKSRFEDCSATKSEAIRIAMSSLHFKYNFQPFSSLLQECLEISERLLQMGGSWQLGICKPAYQLSAHLNDSKNNFFENNSATNFEVLWTEKEKKAQSNYGDGIIHCCETLQNICTKNTAKNSQALEQSINCVWGVLLRSHHRGVLEHCSSNFDVLVKTAESNSGNQHLPLGLLEKTFEFLSRAECQSRDIAFSKILISICTHYPIKCESTILRLLISFDAIEDRVVKLKILHIIQKFLICSSFELSKFHEKICELLLRNSSTNDWKLFSLICLAFAALLDSVFRGQPEMVPLANFLYTNEKVALLILEKLKQIAEESHSSRSSHKFLALLIAPLERLMVLDFPFHNVMSKRFARELFISLKKLLLFEVSLVIRRQILAVLVNLVPYQRREEVLCKSKTLKRSFDAFSHSAFSFITHTLHSDQLEFENDLALDLENLSITNSSKQSFRTTLELVEKNVMSLNVFKKIEAANSLLVMASRLHGENNQLLVRFHACLCVLATDEVEECRLIACQCSSALGLSKIPMDPHSTILSITNYLLWKGLSRKSIAEYFKKIISSLGTRRHFSKFFDCELIYELLLSVEFDIDT